MPLVTIGYAAILILLGPVLYWASDGASKTAFIPSIFGLVFMALGLLARVDKLRKHAMHGAAALALLAIFGTAPSLLKFVNWMFRDMTPERPAAVAGQAIMLVLTVAYLGLCVRSFIQARRARKALEVSA